MREAFKTLPKFIAITVLALSIHVPSYASDFLPKDSDLTLMDNPVRRKEFHAHCEAMDMALEAVKDGKAACKCVANGVRSALGDDQKAHNLLRHIIDMNASTKEAKFYEEQVRKCVGYADLKM